MLFNKELFDFINKHKSIFIFSIIFGLIASIFTILQAFFLSRIINNVFLLNHYLSQVKYLLILFIISFLLKGLFIFFQNNFLSKLVFHIKKNIRESLIKNIIDLGFINLKSERSGEIINTIFTGVDKLEDYFLKYLPQIFLSALIPILILFFVLPKDFLSFIIFIVTAPIIPTFMFLIGSVSEKLNKKQWVSLSRMSAFFFDVLQGISTLKLFNRTKETIKKIDEITNLFRVKTLKVLRVAFLSALVLEIASTISVAIIAVAIGLRLLNNDFNFADALFILIIAPEFYFPLRQLGVSYHSGMEGIAAFDRIKILLNNSEKNNDSKKIEFAKEINSIVFEQVSFSYNNINKPALDSISFQIEKGKITALIGETGSGKTTIMNLLLGFIKAQSGKIKFNDVDINEINKKILREKISWLPQHPYLFNNTILENIKLSKEDATIDEVVNSAKKAKIHNFIERLPNSYNTKVFEAATNFSGGEVQRIALARAYLRNADLICVDEPTSNIDAKTESEIMNDLFELYKNKTVLIIAHKLETIKRADKIILLKEGKIISEGNHEELILKSDYYRKLIQELN